MITSEVISLRVIVKFLISSHLGISEVLKNTLLLLIYTGLTSQAFYSIVLSSTFPDTSLSSSEE